MVRLVCGTGPTLHRACTKLSPYRLLATDLYSTLPSLLSSKEIAHSLCGSHPATARECHCIVAVTSMQKVCLRVHVDEEETDALRGPCTVRTAGSCWKAVSQLKGLDLHL